MKHVVAKIDLAADLPPVRCDRVQLQQVLINLIRNAADAMQEVDERSRALTIRSRRNDDGQVDVTVVDAGVGIDPKYRARIFDPFFTTKSDGMGMGLAICRNIIDAYGGRLTATDNQEGGTTMRFTLPAAEGDVA